MRVLVLNYEFPPIGGGGGEVSKNIARFLVQLGVEVKVLTAHWGNLPLHESIDGYEVYRTPSLRRYPDRCTVREMFAFTFFNLLPSLRLARQWRPDLIHVHFAIPVGPLAYLVKKIYHIPYIVTLHGGDVPGFDPQQTDNWYRFLLPFTRPIWHQASAVISVSRSLYELAQQAYPEVPVAIIPNGIDCDYFTPSGEPPHVSDRVRFIFVGRIAEQKGLAYLIQALPLLRQRTRIPFELQVVGDGPLRHELETLASQLGVSDCIQWTGWVPQSQVRDWLREADAFVLPSLMEGHSIALLQAMGCGLPVVTSDAVGNRDVVHVGENGFLVRMRDVEAWADTLAALIENRELRERMGKCSREMVDSYDWRVITEKYLRTYETCIVRK
jgi:glycosyltransferase involved in cell wall biosynthesis